MNELIETSATVPHVLIVGLGETGIAAARWCARNGMALRIADTRSAPAGLDALKVALGDSVAEFHLGCDTFEVALLEGIDHLVLSPGLAPGLSPVKELLEHARLANVEVIGEIELFARALEQLKSPASMRLACWGSPARMARQQ
jgi:UDP-N-acetylmuramoylalanine--D-glutamate ligase